MTERVEAAERRAADAARQLADAQTACARATADVITAQHQLNSALDDITTALNTTE
ncbi:hypothetical protein ACFO5K_04525 [Nocardia halotolerans]|uniref:Uncharacterized protein n=1 Tax=Nocardia halotolerans TaxID=1755878 RepID=A0ABV8VBN8_9NOCA